MLGAGKYCGNIEIKIACNNLTRHRLKAARRSAFTEVKIFSCELNEKIRNLSRNRHKTSKMCPHLKIVIL